MWGGGGDLTGFEPKDGLRRGAGHGSPLGSRCSSPGQGRAADKGAANRDVKRGRTHRIGTSWRRGWGDSVRPQFLAQVTRLWIESGQLMRELRSSGLEGGCWGADEGGVGGPLPEPETGAGRGFLGVSEASPGVVVCTPQPWGRAR